MLTVRRFVFHLAGEEGAADVNLAPLIDMMFILLIFFLVATSFVTETGVDVTRPSSAAATRLSRESLRIGIDAGGRVFMDRREVGLMSVRARVREHLKLHAVPVVRVLDRATSAQAILRVLDECTAGGARQISLAAEQQ